MEDGSVREYGSVENVMEEDAVDEDVVIGEE